MMGFLSFLAGSTPQGAMAEVAGKATEGLLSGLGDAAIKIRQAIKGKELDPVVLADLEKTALSLEAAAAQGQMEINLEEARSEQWWKAGWRPNIGWACGSAIWYTYFIQPFLSFGIQVAAWWRMAEGAPFPALPILNMTDVMTLVLSLLGMAGLRTYEKKNGV